MRYVPRPTFRPAVSLRSHCVATAPAGLAAPVSRLRTSVPLELTTRTVTEAGADSENEAVPIVLTGSGLIASEATCGGAGGGGGGAGGGGGGGGGGGDDAGALV
jgi:hypothetical protein